MLKRICLGILISAIFVGSIVGMAVSAPDTAEQSAEASQDGFAETQVPVRQSPPKRNPNRPARPEIIIEFNKETPKETKPEPVESVRVEPVQTEPEPTVAETEPKKDSDSGWISLGRFKLTAYCSCSRCCGKYAANRPVDSNGKAIVYTASGARAKAGVTIAVDPGVIPFGTKVRINGHTYTAQDTGGSINGNRIDVYFDSHEKALSFGVQYSEVFIRG